MAVCDFNCFNCKYDDCMNDDISTSALARERAVIKFKKTKFDEGEYARQWYADHKDELLEKRKQYYQDNKEYYLEYARIWRDEHKEYLRAYQREYYQAHKETILKRKREKYRKLKEAEINEQS